MKTTCPSHFRAEKLVFLSFPHCCGHAHRSEVKEQCSNTATLALDWFLSLMVELIFYLRRHKTQLCGHKLHLPLDCLARVTHYYLCAVKPALCQMTLC